MSQHILIKIESEFQNKPTKINHTEYVPKQHLTN